MSGKRSGFAADALHQIAIATDHVNVKSEDRETRPIVARSKPARRDRHSDAVAATLPERARRGFHPCRVAVLRVAWRHGIDLSEPLNIVERNRRSIFQNSPVGHPSHWRQVKEGIQQHRTVPRREHKPVAVGPQRICGVVREKRVPKYEPSWREPPWG